MILIIAGSRDLVITHGMIEAAMENITYPDVVVCGECRGPDTAGKNWAIEQKIIVWSLPAPWSAWGKKAGPSRNKFMAGLADQALIFWNGSPTSHGTLGMIQLMESQHKPTHVVEMNYEAIAYPIKKK